MAVATAAALMGGAGLIGGLIQSDAARSAANTQANAANNATATQLQMYNQTREDQTPWRQAGANALRDMQDQDFNRNFTFADFQADPGYNFRMQEGMKALERSAAARGGLGSGRTLRELTRYGQDFASNEYGNAFNRFQTDRTNRFNRLSKVAGLGETANAQLADAGRNYANNASQNILAAGNAQAAGQIGQANALNSAIGGLTNNWMQMQLLNRMGPALSGVPNAGGSYTNFGSIA